MFQVGDKVKFRDDLEVGKRYGDFWVTSEMGKYKSKETEIVEVSESNNYRLDIDDECFWYSAEMLEPIYEFKVGDKVKIRDGFKFTVGEMRRYKGKETEIFEVSKDGYRLDIDGGMFYYSSEMLEPIYEFKVGDIVKYYNCSDKSIATIWGIAEKEDYFGGKYAISYIDDDGDLINIVVNRGYLSPLKSKYELEKGDKFRCRYDDSILTVKCGHKDPGGAVWYFAVDENNVCEMYPANDIEVL